MKKLSPGEVSRKQFKKFEKRKSFTKVEPQEPTVHFGRNAKKNLQRLIMCADETAHNLIFSTSRNLTVENEQRYSELIIEMIDSNFTKEEVYQDLDEDMMIKIAD